MNLTLQDKELKSLASEKNLFFEIFVKGSIEFTRSNRRLSKNWCKDDFEEEKKGKEEAKDRESRKKNLKKRSQVPDKLLLFAATDFKSACEWVSEIESLLL